LLGERVPAVGSRGQHRLDFAAVDERDGLILRGGGRLNQFDSFESTITSTQQGSYNNAYAQQLGSNESLSVAQNGSYNYASVWQSGANNVGAVTQSGTGNFAGLNQQGAANTATITQH
jgi:hypothetical protein